MKKIIALSLFIILISFPLSAEKMSEISLRSGRQENSVRIVLQSDDDSVRNTNLVTSLQSIRVEFPAPFDMKKPKDFPFEVSKQGRFLIIDLKNKGVVDVKVSKLSAPARLVLDLATLPLPPEKQPEAESRKQAQTSQPSAHKTGQQTMQHPLTKEEKKAGQPVSPPEKTRRTRVVVIDAGHGGYDFGIVAGETREKDVALSLSKDLSAALAKRGVTAYVTRKADQYASIGERIAFANGKKPDLFISLHCSLSNLFAVYTSTAEDLNIDTAVKPYSLAAQQNPHVEQSRIFAKILGTALTSDFDSGAVLRELPLPLLHALNGTAVLIEFPSLKSVVYDQKMRDRCVASILKGIAAYEQ